MDPQEKQEGSSPRKLLVVALVAAVVVLAASVAVWMLGVQPDIFIDGFPVGDPVDCAAQINPTCDEIVRAASSGLNDRLGPRDWDVVAINFEATPIADRPGVRSGLLFVVQFDIGGPRVAAGAYCGVGPCIGLQSYPPGGGN